MTQNEQGKYVLDHKKYKQAGITLDDDDLMTAFNENAFARHLRNKFPIVLRYDSKFYQYANNIYNVMTDLELRRVLYDYFNHILPDGWTAGIENTYITAYTRVIPRSEDMTPGDGYINLKNGIFHLAEWKLLPHDKKIFTTTQLPITYDPARKCPTFVNFLNDIFFQDASLVALTQELLGYCLTNSTSAHKFALFYGRGRNGKSVLLDIITALVGTENTSNISLKSFGAPFELANILDKRVNIATENDLCGANLKTDRIKAIVAGDPIQINAKFEKPFSYRPFVKLFFAVNKMPSATDTSEGFTDRLIIVPFEKKYVADPQNARQGKRDPHLTQKLLEELDGIFVYALEGLRRLISRDYIFTESRKATQLLNQFVATNNPYVDYINKQLCFAKDAKVPRTLIYDNFKNWANNQGFRHHSNISARSFYSDLKGELAARNIPLIRKKIQGVEYFKGFYLANNSSSSKKKPVQKKTPFPGTTGKNNVIDLEEILNAAE